MVRVDPQPIIDELDSVLEELLAAEARLNAASQRFEDQQRVEALKHHAKIAPILGHIDALTARLNALIDENRAVLIKRGRKGFVTELARLEFERTSPKPRVTDHAMVMEIARRLGVTREIATAPSEWQFDSKKFFTWLRWNRKYRDMFEEYIFNPVSRMVWHIYPLPAYALTTNADPAVIPDAVTIEIRELAPH